jgi:hypothetical protein
VPYVPMDVTAWTTGAPSDVQCALDKLAARVKALGG